MKVQVGREGDMSPYAPWYPAFICVACAHDGFIVGCGNGIEGCPVVGFTNEAKQWCRSDPRKAWRSLLLKTNLEGKIVWYRQDNFWNGEENPATSASEYVIAEGNMIVSVNDESFGVGLQTLA